MVMKMPTKSTATSWMAPQVKWLDFRTDTWVVLKERKAASRMTTTSSRAGMVRVTSPKMGMPMHLPGLVLEGGARVGSTPLTTTAATIITRKIRLWSPRMWISVPGLRMSGMLPVAMSLR